MQAFLPPGQILTGCQISPTQSGTVVLQWDSAKLKVNGHAKTLKNIDVQVTVAKFGHSYSMNLNNEGESPATITFQSNMAFGWSSVSGTLTTTKSGISGSVSGTMTAGKGSFGDGQYKGQLGRLRQPRIAPSAVIEPALPPKPAPAVGHQGGTRQECPCGPSAGPATTGPSGPQNAGLDSPTPGSVGACTRPCPSTTGSWTTGFCITSDS